MRNGRRVCPGEGAVEVDEGLAGIEGVAVVVEVLSANDVVGLEVVGREDGRGAERNETLGVVVTRRGRERVVEEDGGFARVGRVAVPVAVDESEDLVGGLVVD